MWYRSIEVTYVMPFCGGDVSYRFVEVTYRSVS